MTVELTDEIRESYVPTSLYIKQHKITGLRYFGKTVQENVAAYSGSGSRWLPHIKKHGAEHVETIWTEKFDNVDDIYDFATFFSEFMNIVVDDSWANRIIETGATRADGFQKGKCPAKDLITGESLGYIDTSDIRWKTGEIVGTTRGSTFSQESRDKMANAKLGKKRGPMSPEHAKKISESQIGTAVAFDSITGDKIGRISSLDPRWKSGEIRGFERKMPKFTEERKLYAKEYCKGNNKGKANAKLSKTGMSVGRVDLEDPRWKTGEIVGQNKRLNIV